MNEAQLCLSSGANLAIILFCGSVLEAVLLGAAQREPEKFNRSPSSPRGDGKVKPFPNRTLSEFINVAHKIGLLEADVHKFGHGLREFGNYIHPYQQLTSGFTPEVFQSSISCAV